MKRTELWIYCRNDEEITPIKDVKKLVRIADSTLSDVVKKHLKKPHIMAPSETRKRLFSLV